MYRGPFGRQDRLLNRNRTDAYQSETKLPDPTLCTSCGVVYQKGRWVWKNGIKNAHEIKCPACRRIDDHYPAGEVKLKGTFFQKHKTEIINLIRNNEKLEKAVHPMERLMTIVEGKKDMTITTTGVHLARRIGENLSRSYKGTFDFKYGDGEKIIRVSWER